MRVLIVVALALCATTGAAQEDVVVVLPLSSSAVAPKIAAAIDSAFSSALGARGWTIAPPADVEEFLESSRIRYLDSLSAAMRKAAHDQLRARAFLVGSVLSFREAGDGDITVAVSARLLDVEGNVIWADVAAMSSGDTDGALGTGRRETAESLTAEVMHRLMKRVPGPSGRAPVRLNRTLGRKAPSTYRSAVLTNDGVSRICVLPFTSTAGESVEVFLNLLTIRLEATGQFDVVEPAELREALAAARIPSVASLTSAELQEVGKLLGTTLFLRGQIHTWRHAPGGRSEVHMDMNLSDVAAGRVLWAVTHHRSGSEYAGLLGRGVVSNVITLSDRVVSEAIATQYATRAKSRPAEPAGSGLGR